jgi:hypothetical protein
MGQDIGAVRYGGVVVGASSLPEAAESLCRDEIGRNKFWIRILFYSDRF